MFNSKASNSLFNCISVGISFVTKSISSIHHRFLIVGRSTQRRMHETGCPSKLFFLFVLTGDFDAALYDQCETSTLLQKKKIRLNSLIRESLFFFHKCDGAKIDTVHYIHLFQKVFPFFIPEVLSARHDFIASWPRSVCPLFDMSLYYCLDPQPTFGVSLPNR